MLNHKKLHLKIIWFISATPGMPRAIHN
jgi:hypothetical protein